MHVVVSYVASTNIYRPPDPFLATACCAQLLKRAQEAGVVGGPCTRAAVRTRVTHKPPLPPSRSLAARISSQMPLSQAPILPSPGRPASFGSATSGTWRVQSETGLYTGGRGAGRRGQAPRHWWWRYREPGTHSRRSSWAAERSPHPLES